jgi:hypothetical protein
MYSLECQQQKRSDFPVVFSPANEATSTTTATTTTTSTATTTPTTPTPTPTTIANKSYYLTLFNYRQGIGGSGWVFSGPLIVIPSLSSCVCNQLRMLFHKYTLQYWKLCTGIHHRIAYPLAQVAC